MNYPTDVLHPRAQAFPCNHAATIAAIDLCVVPTVSFESLFALVAMGHGRRQLLRFAVTRHPTPEWLPQQIGSRRKGRQ